jgi:uncharacterized protein YjbJ (UPF0337 family)
VAGFFFERSVGAINMNRKQLRGAVKGAAGRLEEATGKLIGNRELQRRGLSRRMAGKSESLAGNAMEAIKAALRR